MMLWCAPTCLQRAVASVFYRALSPPIGLKVAQAWLVAMEHDAAADSIAAFESGFNDLFRFLPDNQRDSAEIRFVRLFHALLPVLNAFTLPVPAARSKWPAW